MYSFHKNKNQDKNISYLDSYYKSYTVPKKGLVLITCTHRNCSVPCQKVLLVTIFLSLKTPKISSNESITLWNYYVK